MQDDGYEDYMNQTTGEEEHLCGVCGNKIKVKDSYPCRAKIRIGKKTVKVVKSVCKSCFNK